MAFESLPGVKINDPDNKKTFIIADFFSVYDNDEEIPNIYKWADFNYIAETKDAFILKINGTPAVAREFVIDKELLTVPNMIRIRAIIEGVVAANPNIEYKYGKRILPTKDLCTGFEIPNEAYIATGAYKENEINNSNIILQNTGFDRLLWIFAPIAAIFVLIIQIIFFKNIDDISNIIKYLVIALFAGVATGMSIYLFCVFSAKTLYNKILKEDPALLEEITFVVCEEGFIAAESEVYDYSDIIHWHQVAYFIETNHVYIIFNRNKAVFWLPKRLFPKELHQEIGNFIADRLLQK